MENASKALLIAGGILISVIIVSVLVYMYDAAREMPKAQEQMQEEKELLAFNKKYEAYEGTIRGTDLITVVNMANSNNARYAGEAEMHIKVSFVLKESIDCVIRTYELENNQWVITNTNYSGGIERGTYSNTRIESGEKEIPNDIKNYFKVNTNNEDNVIYSHNSSTWEPLDNEKAYKNKKYYSKTDMVTELKVRKFNCTKVEYNDTTGRIKNIEYEEKV